MTNDRKNIFDVTLIFIIFIVVNITSQIFQHPILHNNDTKFDGVNYYYGKTIFKKQLLIVVFLIYGLFL